MVQIILRVFPLLFAIRKMCSFDQQYLVIRLFLCFFLATGPSHGPIESGLVPGAQRYSYAEITAATDGFKKQIGLGGFGPVHYGRLSNGQQVAIKTLDINSSQGAQEFTNEVCFS